MSLEAEEPDLPASKAAAAGRRIRLVTRWKIVETSSVTDENLEAIVNEWTRQGWTFEGLQFAMRESSKRPAMAFVIFTRSEEAEGDEVG
jgi:hypothetical protein